MHLKILPVKWRPFCPGRDEFIGTMPPNMTKQLPLWHSEWRNNKSSSLTSNWPIFPIDLDQHDLILIWNDADLILLVAPISRFGTDKC